MKHTKTRAAFPALLAAVLLYVATAPVEAGGVNMGTLRSLVLDIVRTELVAMANVAITGGSISGITDLAVADGGTGASTAAGALSNLGAGTEDSPLFKVLVEANTAGSGAPNVLVAAETRTLLTNEGVTAQNYHTLPSAAAGYVFTFVLQDADGVRVVASTGDTIRVLSLVSPTAGYVESTAIGSTITLVAINATEWVAICAVGTWTVST